MYLGWLARVAGVGGVVSAATLLRNRQEHVRDEERGTGSGSQLWRHTIPGTSFHSRLVSNNPLGDVTEPCVDNGSEKEEEEESEAELEIMAETVTKPNELSKQQAQAEKLKAAINKVRILTVMLPESYVTIHCNDCVFRPGIWFGVRCMKAGPLEWWLPSPLMARFIAFLLMN